MNEKSALIIFVRNPVFGKVKTRLAATMGNARALSVYKFLLQHTKEITQYLPVAKFVFYADEINKQDIWNGYEKKLQTGGSLGDRMEQAFENLYQNGYARVVIIGSDCYELTAKKITDAFAILASVSTVIGPSADGGYYLLGMQAPLKDLFTGKNWSTDTVFNDTLQQIRERGHSYTVLPVLNDIDTEEDISAEIKIKAGITLL